MSDPETLLDIPQAPPAHTRAAGGEAGSPLGSPPDAEPGVASPRPPGRKRRAGRLRTHLAAVAAVLVLVVLVGRPLFRLELMSGHDSTTYIPATVEMYEGMRAGHLLPRWAPDLSFGYGEPLFVYFPPLVHALSSLLHALGLGFIAAEHMTCLVLLAAAGAGMYVLAQEFFGARGGLVSAAAYLLAPYLLVSLYVRHGLRDFSALALLPWALWGVYRYAESGRRVPLLAGAAASALLVLGSSSVGLISFPALVAWVGLVAVTRRSWAALPRGALCLALGLLLCAFYWVPALGEARFVPVQRLTRDGWLDYRNHFLVLRQLLSCRWGYDYALPGPDFGMSLEIGTLQLAVALGGAVLIRRIRAASRRAGAVVLFHYALLAVSAFFTLRLSAPIWERAGPLQTLVFPWRFLSLAALSAAFLCGSTFVLARHRRPAAANAMLAVVVCALALKNLPSARPRSFLPMTDRDFDRDAIRARRVEPSTPGFFQPVWVKKPPSGPPAALLTVASGRARVLEAQAGFSDYRFVVEVAEPARLQVSTFYFPGWALRVDGEVRPIQPSIPHGVLELPLEPGRHEVAIRFEETPLRRGAAAASLLGLATLLLALARPLGVLYRVLEVPFVYRLSQALLTTGRPRLNRALFAELFAGSRGLVADIGCGPSPVTPPPDGALVGVDVNESYLRAYTGGFLDRDPAVLREPGERRRFGFLGSASTLPFPDATFDEARTTSFFHHLPDETVAAVLRELSRCLKEGGRMVIIEDVWPKRPWRRPVAWLVRALDRGRHMRHEEGLVRLFLEACPGAWTRKRHTYTYTGLESMVMIFRKGG